MPGLLSRSKSMRLLKGHGQRKDAQHDRVQHSMPRAEASGADDYRYQSVTPVPRSEAKLEAPDMVVRPSTSGGTGDRRTLFHMKTDHAPSNQSQNDLSFFPPSHSTATFDNTEVSDSREGIIGIALGSPTGSHWTPTSQTAKPYPRSRSPDTQMSTFAPSDRFPSPVPIRPEPPKSKLTRWKSLFRKAPPVQVPTEKPPFYQLTTTITATRATRADSHHDDEPTERSANVTSDRQIGRTPSPPAFKPNIRASRSFTSPEMAQTRTRAFTAGSLPPNPRASVQRSATTPFPTSHLAGKLPSMPSLTISKSPEESRTPGGTLLLDVSIPDIKLDRYSVMFNNLLQTNSDRSSSLLARRQGNADKLKPLDALAIKEGPNSSRDIKLQRRATSPTVPSPSPRLSLFPNTTRAASPTVPLSKALYRSKTERSPLRQTYSRNEIHEDRGQDLFVKGKPAALPNLKPRASMNLNVQQLAITPTSIHSFESDTDSVTIVVGRTNVGQAQTLHLDDREPDWEICAKPALKPVPVARANTAPLASLKRTDSQRQPAVTKFSALSSHAPSSAPLEAPSPLQRIQQLQSPPASAREKRTESENRQDGKARAMVGVARSISVSRANSPRTLVKSPGEGTGEMRGFGEGKCLTPTMVDVRQRRSQRVQLVDA